MEILRRSLLLSIVALVLVSGHRNRGRGPQLRSKDEHIFAQEEGGGSSRQGKLFSLFSVVHFPNEPCSTTVTLPSGGGRRNGTCFTSSQCSNKGGRSQGNCAAGFGVCCLFVASDSSSTVNENNTYVQNRGFPSPYPDTTSTSYTIQKSSADVCFIKLDFETFTLMGVGNTADAGTDNLALPCQDQFDVMVSSGQVIPTICGENSGQHMFIAIGNSRQDLATLSFTFSGTSNIRSWDIKVTQYSCTNENAPPCGCLQYHTSLTGRIKTFNYDMANDNHLPAQQYSICIRPQTGYCCVQYSVCPDEPNGFTLSGSTSLVQGNVDSNCATDDFVAIPDSSSTCNQTPGTGPLVSRYCGKFFSDLQASMSHIPICDCTPPHTVDIFTNAVGDSASEVSKGLCLDFTQIPCTG